MTDLEIFDQLLHGNHVEKNDLLKIEARLKLLIMEVQSRKKHFDL